MTNNLPKSKQDLSKALNDRTLKLVEATEVVNRNDVRDLTTRIGTLLMKSKKLNVVILERD